MSNLKSKLAKRIMAIVLSGAMVMSSMTSSNMSAYAAESATETETAVNIDAEKEETVSDSDKKTAEDDEEKVEENAEENEADQASSDSGSGSGSGGGDQTTPPGSSENPESKPESSTPDTKPVESNSAPEGSEGDGNSSAPEGGDGDGSSSTPEGSEGDGSSSAPEGGDGDEEKETIVYELKASEVGDKVADAEDKTTVTIGKDDFFTVVGKSGTANISVKADGDAGNLAFKLGDQVLYEGLGIAWGGSPGLFSDKKTAHTSAGFTVPEGYKADIVIGASAKAKAAIGLYDIYDQKIGIVQNCVQEYEKGVAAVAQFSDIGPGSYYVGNTKKDGYGNAIGGGNSLLYYLRVTLTKVDTVAWEDVAAPAITAEQVDGENQIIVNLSNGVIGAHVGYERIKVAMYSDAACATEALETAYAICDKDNKATLTFKSAKSTGTYYFKAEGIRGENKNLSDVVSVDFKYFLTTPSIASLDNIGEGNVQISWGKDDQASGYELELYTNKDLTTKVDPADYTVEDKVVEGDTAHVTKVISGLTVGNLYYFVVRSYVEIKAEDGTVINTEYSDWSAKARIRVLQEKDPTKYHIEEILKGESLEVDTEYGGQEDIMTFTVLPNDKSASDYSEQMGMLSSSISGGVTIGGVTYNYSVQGKSNPREADGKTTPKGTIPTSGAAFKIIPNAEAPSKIVFVTGAAAGKPYHFIKVSNETNEVLDDKTDANTPEGSLSFVMDPGYTYYFYLEGSKVKVYDIIYSFYVEQEKIDWKEVEDPVISKVEIPSSDKSVIEVTVNASIGTEGGDSLTVEMFDSEGISQGTSVSMTEADTHKIKFTPKKSDSYTFTAKLSRNSEIDAEGNDVDFDDKECEYNEPTPFILPLSQPAMSSVTNLGEGKVDVEWGSVKEATGYIVRAYSDKECKTKVAEVTTKCEFEKDEEGNIKNDEKGNPIIKVEAPTNVELGDSTIFEVGKTYYFTATATSERTDSSKESAAFPKEITKEAQDKWSFAAYSSSTSITSTTKNKEGKSVPKNGFEGDFYNGEVTVWSMGGAGKVVPATVDGLAFYYTSIDPATTNFTLKATAHVNEWTLSNGQDGFGLMAADQVGQNGNGDYLWTNSYQAVVSKIEYNWDGEEVTTDTSKPKIAMKIGVGATEKIGATKEDVDRIATGEITQPVKWSATQIPLDTTYAKYAKVGITTTCNMVGNAGAWDDKKGKWVENVPPSEASETYVDFELTLEKNNTGYFLTYKMPNGKEITQKYYDPEALNHIVEDKVYIGFFAARNANVTFKDIEFTKTAIDPNEKPEDQPTKYITLTKAVSSAAVTNTSDYELIFTSNWDGTLEVRDSNKKIVGKADVTGSLDTEKAAYEEGDNRRDTKAKIEISGLEVGSNVFTLTFTPSKNMKNPPAFTALRNYEPVTITHTVDYRKYGEEGDILYVSPDGKSTGTGTKAEPLDVFTAVKYVQPGQIIYLAGGRYSLYKTITIPSSTNGKPGKDKKDYSNYIKMMADPEAKERPVFDFNEAVTGMTISGDYWYLKGFDVTRSLDGQKGLQLSGSNNVLDQVNAYKNGNTGIQVSGSGNDTYDYWPQNNLILNCTSFLNADAGYEDADGFAAKLTIGSGNVFDGCIAAYNADDGWDLFAKIQTGQIGSVTIQNCVAYKNGYVLGRDGSNTGALDLEGQQVNAGNGNGFKMGGDALPGGSIHDLDEDGSNYFEKYGTYKGHILKNSVAFQNKSKGIDSNSCPNNKIYNCISFNNEGPNVGLYTYTNVQKTEYVVNGVISYRTSYKGVSDDISAKGQTDYKDSATYLWDSKQKASVNADSNKVESTWFTKTKFKGTNTTYADKNSVLLGRNSNGTINMDGFLVLTSEAGKPNVGLGEGEKSPEDLVDDKVNKETEGNVSTGNSTIVDDTTSPELAEEQNNVKAELTKDKNYGLYVKYLEDVEYTGKAVQPEFRVYLNGTLFTDYKASFKNNVNAYVADDPRYKDILDTKRPTLILTLKGSYQGTYEYYFDIDPVDITNQSLVSVTGLSGKDLPSKFAPTLIYNGKKLAANKDYTATLTGSAYKIDATTGSSGNFTGIKEGTYKTSSSATDISKAAFKLAATSATYTGQPIEPALAALPSGISANDLDIVYSNNTDVGKATVTIAAKESAASIVGSKTLSFTIKKAALKLNDTVTVTGINPDGYSYTGAALSPGTIKVVAKSVTGSAIEISGVKKGDKDVNDKDENGLYKYGYTYQYKANTEAGNATLTISGIHNFSGNVNVKFKITPPTGVTATTLSAENSKYKFTNKGLEVAYDPTAEYTPNGTIPDVIIKYNGNTVSKKNYSISYKTNKNAADKATATVKWKGSLKGTAPVDFSYTVEPCDFTTGNITAKSVSDVFTNGKPSIKLSELEKSKVVLVNVKKTLAKNRDYRLVYKYQEPATTTTTVDGQEVTQTTYTEKTYDPQNKDAGKTEITIPKETGLDVTVYAIPVGTNYKPNDAGIQVAEFRVAYYNIAQAKMQLISKTTEKATKIYFVDDTESKRANLGALNRLNNKTKDANSTAPYYLVVSHSKAGGELEFSNFENKGNEERQKDYTYDYENTATTVAGKQSVTIYGTGMFGGTKVFKYDLIKKTYNLKTAIVDTKNVSVTIPKGVDAATAIKEALEGKITMNGNILSADYIEVSYDASKLQSGKSLKVTITGAVVNKVQVYSGFKTISIKIASAAEPPKEEGSSEAVESSNVPESSDVTETSKAPENPDVTETSKAPESPDVTETSKTSESL